MIANLKLPEDGYPMSMEAALGVASERYFAEGYRHVEYAVGGFEDLHLSPPEYQATGSATYPKNWSSRSGGGTRQPHLSSVDAIVIPLILLESVPPDVLGADLEGMRITAVRLRAGTEPWMRLDEIPVVLRILHSRHADELTVEAQVGNIRVRIGADLHRTNASNTDMPDTGKTKAKYLEGFESNESKSVLSSYDSASRTLEGHHSFYSSRSVPTGIPRGELTALPSLTVVDYLVTMGQLTQAVIHQANHTSRAAVGNLWMRSMELTLDKTPSSLPTAVSTKTHITRDRKLERCGNELHDVVVASQTSDGVFARASLAYSEGRGI